MALQHESNHFEGADAVTGKALVENAAVGNDTEHELSPLQAIKAYPMAVFWCLIVSLCVVMVSYFFLHSLESH